MLMYRKICRQCTFLILKRTGQNILTSITLTSYIINRLTLGKRKQHINKIFLFLYGVNAIETKHIHHNMFSSLCISSVYGSLF